MPTRRRPPTNYIAHVPLSAEERAELAMAAAHERTTYAELIRRAIRAYAEKRR
jgi:hypothetical protein